MNRLIKYLTLAAAVAGLAATVRANPIIGGISMSGTVTYPGTTTPANATGFNTFTSVVVSSAVSGSYVGVVLPGAAITMTPFTFNPFPGSGIVPLWVTTANPTTASFDLTQLVSMSQGVDSVGNPFLNLNGYGMLHLVGFSDTIGNWSYTAQSGGTTFSFSSSNTALPDGGTTALLLGAGLTGLALISRRQKRKS